MDNELYELEERARIDARDRVSDDVLVARMLASPDAGGRALVALSQFVANRVPNQARAGDGTRGVSGGC